MRQLRNLGWTLAGVLALALVLMSPSFGLAEGAKERVDKMVQSARESVTEISAAELKKLMEENKNLVIVDVREPGEFTDGHIKGSDLIPRGLLEWTLTGKYDNPDTPIVFYCAVGGRSALTTKLAKDLGYTNVKNLRGGFQEWADAGFEVQK